MTPSRADGQQALTSPGQCIAMPCFVPVVNIDAAVQCPGRRTTKSPPPPYRPPRPRCGRCGTGRAYRDRLRRGARRHHDRRRRRRVAARPAREPERGTTIATSSIRGKSRSSNGGRGTRRRARHERPHRRPDAAGSVRGHPTAGQPFGVDVTANDMLDAGTTLNDEQHVPLHEVHPRRGGAVLPSRAGSRASEWHSSCSISTHRAEGLQRDHARLLQPRRG